MSNTMEVRTERCPNCGLSTFVMVDVDGYFRWKGGEHIQTALPLLTTNQRELLLTGTHPDCWDEMFPEEEEEGYPHDWPEAYGYDEGYDSDLIHEYDCD